MSFRKLLLSGASVASALVVSSALAAHNIEGVVTDGKGKPISNAKISVHGSTIVLKTDANGRFKVMEQVQHADELHIVAAGYNHASVGLSEQTSLYNIVLSPALIERIDVTATPLHGSTLESATPITVLSDEELKNKHASTLGETLKGELGVHSSYYGPVSSTPIIRGLDGPRVLIAQNGLDVGDASRVGPDHVVSTETSTVKQIEVLRGPATLFYGSGAIGGVVNVVDNRVPKAMEESAEVQLSFGDVADESEFSVAVNTGIENAIGSNDIALHGDGFYRDSSDYKVPGNPELHDEHDEDHDEDHDDHDEHEEVHGSQLLENSASRSKGFNVGASLLLDNGFVGISVGYLDRLYGIPGHAHAHGEEHDEDHDEHEEDHDEHEEHDEHAEEGYVMGDMRQTRIQIASEFSIANSWVTGINTRFGITNYQHQELEFDEFGDSEVGTQFNNDAWELRSDLLLADINDWHGALTFDIKSSDFEAIGEEAFTPPSETKSYAIGLLEEKHFDDVLVQLGARAENVSIDSDLHSFEFTPVSLSAGLVYDFTSGYNFAASYTHSSRAPSAAELLSYGAHIGTNSFEIGAIYSSVDGSTTYNESAIEEETSNNIELSLRKFEGNTGFVINAFYNEVDDFYYQANTGVTIDELNTYKYEARNAEFYGVEAQWVWQASSDLKVTLQADSINGKLSSGEYLPRIPPVRLGTTFNYEMENTALELSVMHNFEQDKVAELETATDAYTMVDVKVNHYMTVNNIDMTVFAKINNVFDEEARVHTSFLKNDTLLPSRAFVLGFRAAF
ncbi:zinc piracy TonB-dependent receptor ZnuD [Psychrosphaera haliotis]|uniref:TonB-dependent receptor n=1 Tax=Psychrosphaera haliotis TaxID=555083 RepID=UPI0031D267E3